MADRLGLTLAKYSFPFRILKITRSRHFWAEKGNSHLLTAKVTLGKGRGRKHHDSSQKLANFSSAMVLTAGLCCPIKGRWTCAHSCRRERVFAFANEFRRDQINTAHHQQSLNCPNISAAECPSPPCYRTVVGEE